MRLVLIFIIISLLPVPAIAGGFIDGRINSPLSEKIECNSQLRDKFFGVGELTQKAKFGHLKEDGSFIEKESYLIKSDKVMIILLIKIIIV